MKTNRHKRTTRSGEGDDFNREIELTRENRQLMKLLESRAKQKATISMEEARRQLNLD